MKLTRKKGFDYHKKFKRVPVLRYTDNGVITNVRYENVPVSDDVMCITMSHPKAFEYKDSEFHFQLVNTLPEVVMPPLDHSIKFDFSASMVDAIKIRDVKRAKQDTK